MALLDVENLTRYFTRRGDQFAAVDNVTLSVDAGTFLALRGRSGNGKTTLLNMLTGLLRPSKGRVCVRGKDLAGMTDAQLSELRNQTFGYVTQRETLIAGLTVFNNVMLPGLLYLDAGKKSAQEKKDERAALEARASELLQALEIDALADSYPKELSGGEVRRVAIARALLLRPPVFIADEPTGDLDSSSTDLVLGLLRKTADEGSAVIMVTHDQEALSVADRIYEMEQGRLLT